MRPLMLTSQAAKPRRHVSAPLATLLWIAGCSPAKIYASTERLKMLRRTLYLGRSHPHVRAVRQTTGVRLARIHRLNQHLLTTIEDFENVPIWKYYEVSRNNCFFEVVAEIPETLRLAVVGRPLKTLVDSHPALSNLIIRSISDHDHWAKIQVEPTWFPF